MSVTYRQLRRGEAKAASRLKRLAAALIPGAMVLYSPAEDHAFYRDVVFRAGPIWGAWEEERLLGFMATAPGWIDHLYVDPDRHGEGIGRKLLAIAQRGADDLQLWTFQANARARGIYEAVGFRPEQFTDGSQNEELQPDVRYRWRREGQAA